ncbi:MAG: hypothetical protein ACYC5X_12535 [Syntrophales bacterium]
MELVKRCNDPVIALLIILPALYVRFALQKINRATISPSTPKENQSYPTLKLSLQELRRIFGPEEEQAISFMRARTAASRGGCVRERIQGTG